MDYKELISNLEASADPVNARAMSKYMKNLFPFYGIKADKVKEISKPFIKALKEEEAINWDIVDSLYKEDKRECQYIALSYLEAVRKKLTLGDIGKIKDLVLRKSHWDSVDSIDQLLGEILLNYDEGADYVIAWSKDENFWVRRCAIDCQLRLKEKTNKDLLKSCILNNLGSKEFFINKAIGWSLREYSKVNRKWVKDFLEEYRHSLSNLSYKEGAKYVIKKE